MMCRRIQIVLLTLFLLWFALNLVMLQSMDFSLGKAFDFSIIGSDAVDVLSLIMDDNDNNEDESRDFVAALNEPILEPKDIESRSSQNPKLSDLQQKKMRREKRRKKARRKYQMTTEDLRVAKGKQWVVEGNEWTLREPPQQILDGEQNTTDKKLYRRAEKMLNRSNRFSHRREILPPIVNMTSSYCLTSECFYETANPLARAFPDQLNTSKWCLPKTNYSKSEEARENSTKGLLYVKVPKCASSTMAAIVLRLAHRHDCNMDYVRWEHRRGFNYADRDKHQSFLLLSVRKPDSQIISNLFWSHVTVKNRPPQHVTEDWVLRKLKTFDVFLGTFRYGQGGMITQFAALDRVPKFSSWSYDIQDIIHQEQIVARINDIIQGYDFILVVERMDESLVALALILGLDLGDMLVTSSKVSRSKTEDNRLFMYNRDKGRCMPVAKSFIGPKIRAFLDSDEFVSQSYGDFLLHAVANLSLDLTIDRLGKERFGTALQEFRRLKEMEQKCTPYADFPCSSNGRPQLQKAKESCYKQDLGCGYKCIDDMLFKQRNSSGQVELMDS